MARRSRKNTVQQPNYQVAVYIRTAVYIRLSVEDNKRSGNAIENQQLVVGEYLSDKPEFKVYNTYIDNGMSGTNFNRPGFQQMLSDIEAGHIQCVIVKDLSRLGRNTIDTGYYIEQYFYSKQIRFISVTDQFDTANPNNLHGGIMIPLKNMINEAYANDIGRKIKAQTRQAMKDGEYIGARSPYGYRKDPQNCHKLLIDEETAKVVFQIFQWAYEHVSLNDIVRRLNEMQIPSPSHYKKSIGDITNERLIGNGKWQTRTVAKILSSEVYTGDLVQGKTKTVDHRQILADEDNLIVVKGTHEPIISHKMFDAVQSYRQEICARSKGKEKKPYTPNLFKGKVFCAHCGTNLHRQRGKRKKGPDVYMFHCLTNSRIAKDSCEGVLIKETDLMEIVMSSMEKELSVALGMSLPFFQMEAQRAEKKRLLNMRISDKQQEAERFRLLIRGLYENYIQSILDSEEYLALKADYEKKIRKLSAEIFDLTQETEAIDKQFEQYQTMEQNAKILMQNHELTASLIDRLIERIEITHEHEINITFKFQNLFTATREAVCK